MKNSVTIVALLALLTSTLSPAHACKCAIDRRPIGVRVREFLARPTSTVAVPGQPSVNYTVFRGTVERLDQDGSTFHVSMAVNRVWKGAVNSRTMVSTAVNEAACGFNFVPG